eukprot:m.141296 g.141296  ORF g.141296 m.141296 type:complete len:218 (-) comp10019_c6_seq1:135-788(-)
MAALLEADRALSARLFMGQWPSVRPMLKALEYSAHGIPWLIGVPAMLVLASEEWAVLLVNLFIGLLADLGVVGLVKMIVRRQRPSYNKGLCKHTCRPHEPLLTCVGPDDMFATVAVDVFSFPSGHTTRSFFLASFLAAHLEDESAIATWWYWAVAVGCSRVFLGRHHVLDVLFGAAIGYGLTYLLHSYLWCSEKTALELQQRLVSYLAFAQQATPVE